ncbi:PfkB family carbohydrate kinase [Geodermatophilus sp. SYSU D00867]
MFLDRAHAVILADGPRPGWRVPGAAGSVGGTTDVVVLGQAGRDLVLQVGRLPSAGGSAEVLRRIEVLGGKGANQAVALAQMGVPVALVGVVGDDGDPLLAQARADGVDVSGVRRRPGVPSALLVDVVGRGGARRLLEDVPDGVLLTAGDVAAAADLVAGCQALSLQMQQPGEAVRAALDLVRPDALVVADGAPADDATRDALLARAAVLRADAAEAALLVGRDLDGVDDVREAALELRAAGPRLVVLSAGADGEVVAWRAGGSRATGGADRPADGVVRVPLSDSDPVDPTGGGDAHVAGLVAALLGGAGPAEAARTASAAATLTVRRLGGRPDLSPAALAGQVARERVVEA